MPSSDEDCNIQECVEASGDGSEDTSEAPDAEGGGREWFVFYLFFSIIQLCTWWPSKFKQSSILDLVNNTGLYR